MKEELLQFKKNFDHFPFTKQFIKFCLVGGIAALINFSVLYLLVEFLSVWYVAANFSGGVVSAIFNFISNKFWTFRNKEKGKVFYHQGIKFVIVISCGVFLNTFLVYLITEFLKFDYRISWIIATGIVTFWNFGFNRFWTFRNKMPLNNIEIIDYNKDN